MRGKPRVIAIPSALAATGIEHKLTGEFLYVVVSLAVHLTTAAGGAARQLIAELVDASGALVFGVAAPGTQIGGIQCDYSFAPLCPANGSSALGFQQAPFVGGELPENLTVKLSVANTSPADRLSNARLVVAQWPLPE